MTCSAERMGWVGQENTEATSGGGYLCNGRPLVSSYLHTQMKKIPGTLLSFS